MRKFAAIALLFGACWIGVADDEENRGIATSPADVDAGVSHLDNPPPLPGDDGPPWELPPQDLNKRCRRGCIAAADERNYQCSLYCERRDVDDDECIACYEDSVAEFFSCLRRCDVLYPPAPPPT